MKYKFFSKFASAFLGALITFNSISAVAAFSTNPFEKDDSLREKIVSSASGKSNSLISLNRRFMGNETRYITVFKKDVSLSKIGKILNGYNYRLLADSDERIFLIYLSAPDEFFKSNENYIESFEKDSVKENLGYYPNDTYSTAYELSLLGMNEAWSYSLGNPEITVAILDSGIDRYHEDFAGTNILSGFDYESGQSLVEYDSTGHGTKVAGIIAAAGNNGIGCVGIAPKCTLLPLKITNSQGKIYTSDFIDSLYLSADSGADVINMSLGGYEKLESEEKAVKYAVNKGCILVAASGNEGNDAEYAGKKCYPASYDGVISVGSVDENGNSCIFSQHNDSVDIAAPGSRLSLLNSGSGYTTDSGTSFSSAYISGVAALVLSVLDEGYTMSSDQFDYLISSCATGVSDNRTGAGLLSPTEVLKRANYPLISGVENGKVYYDNVYIFFNRGSATLDGEEFKSGELCKYTGTHTLVVTDGELESTVSFTTDNLPLSYNLKEGDGYSYVTFPYGTATLNGHPYFSGEPIRTEGKHTLVLTGLYGNSQSFDFSLSFARPQISGVENGKTYSNPLCISVATGGKIYLNGKEQKNEFTVYEEGTHTLLIKQNGNIKTSVTFTISYEDENNPYKYFTIDTSLAGAKSVSDGSVVAVWNTLNRGIRIYDVQTASLLRYINVGENILSLALGDEYLYIAGTNHIFGVKKAELKQNAVVETLYESEFPMSAADFNGNAVYFSESNSITSGTVKKLFLDSFEEREICFIRNIPDIISYDPITDSIAFSKKEFKTIYLSPVSGESLSMLLPFDNVDSGFIFRNGKIACEGSVFSVEKNRIIFTVNDKSSLYFDGQTLITEKAEYNIETGEVLGYSGIAFSSVSYGNGLYTALFGDVSLYVAKKLPTAKSPSPVSVSGEDFGYTKGYFTSIALTHTVSSGGKIYATGEENALYILNGETLNFENRIYLPFVPTGLEKAGNKIYAFSENIKTLAVYRTDIKEIAFYTAPDKITDMAVSENHISLVCRGDLYVYDMNGNKLLEKTHEDYLSVTFSEDGKNLYTILYKSFYTILASFSIPLCEKEYERILDYEIKNIFCDDTYLYINTASYFAKNGGVAASCSGKIYGRFSNVFITENGAFTSGKYISSMNASGEAFILGENELFVFDGHSVTKFFGFAGEDISTPPAIWGVEDGGEYAESVTVEISKGIAYLNGNQITSPYKISEGGEHSLLIVLPFGINYSYRFKINASLSEIRIKGGDTAMKVNDTKMFQVEFLPVGSPSEKVMFYCEDDVLSVTSDGVVTALKEGEATLYAATMDGRLYTKIKIHVLSSMLSFTSPFLKTDRANDILYGISSGTTVEQILSYVDASQREDCKIYLGEEKASGIAKSGMTIALSNKKGEIIDELLISVIGDCNGDGNVDIGDLSTACSLMTTENAPAVFIRSADFSNTGTIDVADIFTYKEIVLGNESGIKNANTPKDEFDGDVIFRCQTEEDGTVSVKIFVKGKHTSGLSGKIFYDTERFTFISHEKIGYINDTESFSDHVSFFTVLHEESADLNEEVLMAELTFLPVSNARGTFLAKDILAFSNQTYFVKERSLSSTEMEDETISYLSISSGTLSPSFSPDVSSYVLKLPFGTESLTITHDGKEGAIFLGKADLADGNVIKLSLGGKEYTLTVEIIDVIEATGSFPLALVLSISALAVASILAFVFRKRLKEWIFAHWKFPKG